MPRCARVKSYDSVYHVMVRSISDVNLFRKAEDKEHYIDFYEIYVKNRKSTKFK